ncbi:MAG: hypothetical protein ABR498_04650 [Candidatus Dormibacteria bacterium]
MKRSEVNCALGAALGGGVAVEEPPHATADSNGAATSAHAAERGDQ